MSPIELAVSVQDLFANQLRRAGAGGNRLHVYLDDHDLLPVGRSGRR